MTLEFYNRVIFNEGDRIFEEGQIGQEMYYIEKGTVEIWIYRDHKKKVISTLGAGKIFGEMAVIDQSLRSANATALDCVVCIKVHESKLQEALSQSPPFIQSLVKILVKHLRNK